MGYGGGKGQGGGKRGPPEHKVLDVTPNEYWASLTKQTAAEDSDEEDEDSEDESAEDVERDFYEKDCEEELEGAGSDGEGPMSIVRSPFGPETFPSTSAFWEYVARQHSLCIESLRAAVGPSAWTDYHRIRLVNYLRSLGPEAARREAPLITAESPLWSDDSLLAPVLEDDPLLFEDEDGDWDDFGTTSMASLRASSEEELAALRAELASLRRLLGEESADTAAASSAEEASRLRAEILAARQLLSS